MHTSHIPCYRKEKKSFSEGQLSNSGKILSLNFPDFRCLSVRFWTFGKTNITMCNRELCPSSAAQNVYSSMEGRVWIQHKKNNKKHSLQCVCAISRVAVLSKPQVTRARADTHAREGSAQVCSQTHARARTSKQFASSRLSDHNPCFLRAGSSTVPARAHDALRLSAAQ